MENAARILIIEDCADDAFLIRRELSRVGINCVTHLVDEWPKFVEAVDQFKPDLILADQNLPGFEGVQALTFARKELPHVPFILVSGVVGEDWADQSLLQGATDCILKSRMARLGPGVKRALHDADRHKQATQAILDAEARYQKIVENAVDGIFQSTPDGRLVNANQALAIMLGYQNSDDLISSVDDLAKDLYVRPSDREQLKTMLQERGKVHGFEVELYRKDRSIIWVSTTGRAVTGPKGTYYEGTVHDITVRKQAEQALRESERRFRTLFESAPIGIALLDSNGRFLDSNWTHQQMLGYDKASLQQLSPAQLVPPEDAQLIHRALTGFREGGIASLGEETRIREKNGKLLWVRLAISAVRAARGELQYLIAMFQDITAQKEADLALKESQDYARNIISNSSDMIIVTDKDRRITEFNKAAEETFGYRREEVLGKEVSFLYADPASGEISRKTVLQKKEYRTEVMNRRKSGELFPSSLSASILTNAKGEFLGVVGISRDITEAKREEARRKIFSNLGHELSSAATIQEAARIIVSAALDLIGWDSCYLHLYSLETNKVTSVINIDSVDGRRVDVPAALTGEPPSPLMKEVFQHGGRLILRDRKKNSAELVPFGDVNRASQSILIVPMRNGPKVIGIVSIQSYRSKAYHKADLLLLQNLADHCGGALERISVAETLRENEARHKALLDAMPDCMFRLRRDGTILNYSIPANSRLYRQQRRPTTIENIFPPEVLGRFRQSFEMALLTGELQTSEFQLSSEDSKSHCEVRLIATGPDEGMTIIRDITERKRLEKEILEISALEQRRIGQDLHDGLGQDLTGVAFMARTLEETLLEKESPEANQAAQIGKFVSDAIKKARTLSRGLLQAELEMNGLMPALHELTVNVSRMFNVNCFLRPQPGLTIRDFPGSVHVYRIAQEALSNAIKHGRATEIEVSLTEAGGRKILKVANNGLEETAGNGTGMGLRIMEYRARSIGATLAFTKLQEGGIELACSFVDTL